MMQAVVIDDDKGCRKTIEDILQENCPDIQITGQAASVEEGKQTIIKNKPDLLFLDIELTDGNAFDLLAEIKDIGFHVIFITAFDQYAIQAIRHSAIDYILKPIDPDLFLKAVNKARQINTNNDLLARQVKLLIDNRNNFNKIALPTIDGLRFINIDDIIYCKSEANYTWVYLKNNENFLVTKTLKEYDETLSKNNFVRIHQSYLININYVERYVKGKGGSVIMSDGTEILVSRRKKEYFLRIMKGKI